ncbi:MAG TPA: hypothetical protein VLD61_10490 [Methylomirabilota bacterium]|nr:hypothetical protein [Methylomirabilota bacterium]
MPHVLHLVRDPADPVAREVIARQVRDPATRVSVVLLGNGSAADTWTALPVEIHRLVPDPTPVTASPHPPLTYTGLLDLIFAADRVVTW